VFEGPLAFSYVRKHKIAIGPLFFQPLTTVFCSATTSIPRCKLHYLFWEDGDQEAGGFFVVDVEFVELVEGFQAGQGWVAVEDDGVPAALAFLRPKTPYKSIKSTESQRYFFLGYNDPDN